MKRIILKALDIPKCKSCSNNIMEIKTSVCVPKFFSVTGEITSYLLIYFQCSICGKYVVEKRIQ
jgi:hypothetical protein